MSDAPKEYEPNDVGDALRLVDFAGKDMRYCPELGSWLVWDGKRWKRDDEGRARQSVKALARHMRKLAEGLGDRTHAKRLSDHAFDIECDHKIRAILNCAQTEPALVVRADQLDADPMRLNATNCTVDLRTGEALPHQREHLITKLAGADYEPDAEAPLLGKFLRRVFNCSPDLIGFMQRYAGYGLTGLVSEQCLLMAHGAGANGKSTLLETLRRAWGEYAVAADFSSFLARRDDGPRNDIARLRGARLVTAMEVSEGRRLSEAMIKSLTGGDMVAARFLYREAFEFVPQFKLVLGCNHRPIVRGDDLAIWRRIKLVPFEVTIPEPERDPRLSEKLAEELPGVLAWAVAGCLLWQADGLQASAEVTAATAGYRDEMDVLGEFISDCCLTGQRFEAGATLLYQAYRRWCEQNGERAATQTAFGRRLKDRGFTSDNKRIRAWKGIGLCEGCEGLGAFAGNAIHAPS